MHNGSMAQRPIACLWSLASHNPNHLRQKRRVSQCANYHHLVIARKDRLPLRSTDFPRQSCFQCLIAAGIAPRAVLPAEVIGAAGGGKPEFLLCRVAVDDHPVSVRQFRFQHVAGQKVIVYSGFFQPCLDLRECPPGDFRKFPFVHCATILRPFSAALL